MFKNITQWFVPEQSHQNLIKKLNQKSAKHLLYVNSFVLIFLITKITQKLYLPSKQITKNRRKKSHLHPESAHVTCYCPFNICSPSLCLSILVYRLQTTRFVSLLLHVLRAKHKKLFKNDYQHKYEDIHTEKDFIHKHTHTYTIDK